MRRSTIDDVAKAAGVARVTVSRVLNNEQNVRPETREKVRRAVEALGYSVNQQARALASGAGRTILLIHSHDPDREPNSYYHSGLELGALRACSALGFDLVTRAVDPRREDRNHLISSIIERERPAGIVLPPPLSDDVELLLAMKQAGVRTAAVSAGEQGRAIVSSAGVDERAGGRALGEYLTSLGHSRIAFIKGPEDHLAAALRYDGFLDALRAANVREEPWTAGGDFTFKSGVRSSGAPASRVQRIHRARLRQRRHGGGCDACPASGDQGHSRRHFGYRIRRYAHVGNRLAAADDDQAADQGYCRARGSHPGRTQRGRRRMFRGFAARAGRS